MSAASDSSQRITPRTLKGFRDFLPEAMIPRENLLATVRRVYRSYGFSPIETPALEYLEILLGKGGEETDKQMYRFNDHGGRSVGMRFDLTVPLARFVAQHINELGIPFKRYHIGLVWRGENTQRGRYREFLQCDFDTIGSTSPLVDIEAVLVVHDLMHALGIERFTIHVNNRQVLAGLLEGLELRQHETAVLRALDKLAKIGADRVADEIQATTQTSPERARRVVELASVQGSADEVLGQLEKFVTKSETGMEGVGRLRDVLRGVEGAGADPGRVCLNVSIARGLDYYTSTVLETTLDDLPSIGSVVSGGRYDNLADRYTRQKLPGVGASLGLDRLLAAMEELGLVEKVRTPAEVFVPLFEADHRDAYLRMAAALRQAGFAVEVYPESKKLGKQLQYADRRGHRVAVIVGQVEFEQQACQLKDLATGQATTTPWGEDYAELIDAVREMLQ